jgi:hypothetical protein
MMAQLVSAPLLYAQEESLAVTDGANKPRVIITTDGELEGNTSFLHYLIYANEFETLGLVTGNSFLQQDGGSARYFFLNAINAYSQVFQNLQKHGSGWPAPDKLRQLVKNGNLVHAGMNAVGEGKDTPGSDMIADALLQQDSRPIWILAWGGTDDTAQALYKISKRYPDDLDRVIRKIRIFAVSFQDTQADSMSSANSNDSAWWLLRTFPGIFIIQSRQYMAINRQHGPHPYSNDVVFSSYWLNEYIRQKHGPLGALYPQASFAEGDALSFLYLLNPELGNPEDPSQGGWGGRYRRSTEYQGLWVDASDDNDVWKPVWRWIPQLAWDYAARMDYCLNDFHEVNHRPVVVLDTDGSTIEALPGQKLQISASGTTDPDNNNLKYTWWHYMAAGTVNQYVVINNNYTPDVDFIVPTEPGKTMHLILEVSDDGNPKLASYRRLIIKIKQ